MCLLLLYVHLKDAGPNSPPRPPHVRERGIGVLVAKHGRPAPVLLTEQQVKVRHSKSGIPNLSQLGVPEPEL